MNSFRRSPLQVPVVMIVISRGRNSSRRASAGNGDGSALGPAPRVWTTDPTGEFPMFLAPSDCAVVEPFTKAIGEFLLIEPRNFDINYS